MGSYLANFTVYAMAMTGLIFLPYSSIKSDERWISPQTNQISSILKKQ